MVKVKICGITNLEDALFAAGQGADALGFVLYKNSPRYINPRRAKAIISQLPRSIKKAGVFVHARQATVNRLAAGLNLDMLQFHSNESGECQLVGVCPHYTGPRSLRQDHTQEKGDRTIQGSDVTPLKVP